METEWCSNAIQEKDDEEEIVVKQEVDSDSEQIEPEPNEFMEPSGWVKMEPVSDSEDPSTGEDCIGTITSEITFQNGELVNDEGPPLLVQKTEFNDNYCSDNNKDETNDEDNSLNKPIKPKSFICELCGKNFTRKQSLKRHSKKHTDADAVAEKNETEPLKLSSVDSTTSSDLKVQLTDTTTKEATLLCHDCGECFPTNAMLKDHAKTHKVPRSYTCEFCEKVFYKGQSYKSHRMIHTGERPYTCDKCGKSFITGPHLKRHIRLHTGEKPYKCEICYKAFADVSYLKIHLRTHTGEKPYKCTECDKSFNGSSHLKRHKRTHTGERPYECEVCGDRFVQSSHYKTHKKKHKLVQA